MIFWRDYSALQFTCQNNLLKKKLIFKFHKLYYIFNIHNYPDEIIIELSTFISRLRRDQIKTAMYKNNIYAYIYI